MNFVCIVFELGDKMLGDKKSETKSIMGRDQKATEQEVGSYCKVP